MLLRHCKLRAVAAAVAATTTTTWVSLATAGLLVVLLLLWINLTTTTTTTLRPDSTTTFDCGFLLILLHELPRFVNICRSVFFGVHGTSGVTRG